MTCLDINVESCCRLVSRLLPNQMWWIPSRVRSLCARPRKRILRTAGDTGHAGAERRGIDDRGDAMALPLWAVVSKEGLQTKIEFHGEWVFTNHLPQEVQVREVFEGLRCWCWCWCWRLDCSLNYWS